jgi:hypothetical protein
MVIYNTIVEFGSYENWLLMPNVRTDPCNAPIAHLIVIEAVSGTPASIDPLGSGSPPKGRSDPSLGGGGVPLWPR